MNEPRTWGIHAGKDGDADTLFLQHGCVAIGWIGVGDLSKLDPDRSAFKRAFWQAYPEKSKWAVPGLAGQLFRFVHEIAVGDLVVYSSKKDQEVHVGRVTGPYRYDRESDPWFHSIRPVKWLETSARGNLSPGARKAIGHRSTLVQINRLMGEFLPD